MDRLFPANHLDQRHQVKSHTLLAASSYGQELLKLVGMQARPGLLVQVFKFRLLIYQTGNLTFFLFTIDAQEMERQRIRFHRQVESAHEIQRMIKDGCAPSTSRIDIKHEPTPHEAFEIARTKTIRQG